MERWRYERSEEINRRQQRKQRTKVKAFVCTLSISSVFSVLSVASCWIYSGRSNYSWGAISNRPLRRMRRRPLFQPIRDLLRRRFDQRFQTARGQDRDRFLIDALAVGLARREVRRTATIYKR